jgi:hypothetical protein
LSEELQKKVRRQLKECKNQLTAAGKQKESVAGLLHSVEEQNPMTILEKNFGRSEKVFMKRFLGVLYAFSTNKPLAVSAQTSNKKVGNNARTWRKYKNKEM